MLNGDIEQFQRDFSLEMEIYLLNIPPPKRSPKSSDRVMATFSLRNSSHKIRKNKIYEIEQPHRHKLW